MPEESVPLGQLAEEFSARLRAGETPTIEEYAARYPHLAHRIRELFPTLLLLQGMAVTGGPPANPTAASPVAAAPKAPPTVAPPTVSTPVVSAPTPLPGSSPGASAPTPT